MIKNIIFDYGNTIVEFIPENIVKSYGITDKGDRELLVNGIFKNGSWTKLDDDSISQEDFNSLCLTLLPERLHNIAGEICRTWHHHLPFVPGMDDFVKRLKLQGYKIYLLSNISILFANDKDMFPIFDYFDGLVFTGPIKIIKPDKRVYEHILSKYNLCANESVFFDDNALNIDAARGCGIHSFLFKGNAEEAEKYLLQLTEEKNV